MAANMKSVKLRIKSVQSTMQITRAMELVASSKLRKAKDRADTCRPYFKELYQTLQDIADNNTDFSSVYTKPNTSARICYIVIGGDRGLAGGYNSNIFKLLEQEKKDQDIVLVPIGKKALEYAERRQYPLVTNQFGQVADISVADCFEIANILCTEFKKNEFTEIRMIYTTFLSMLSQKPDTCSILPLSSIDQNNGSSDKKTVHNLTLYEPDAQEVFDAIVPEYLAGLIYGAICESIASELAARRNAMESATSNAEEMIEKLNLYYNRARQASITQEITEIVGGAEGV